LIDVAPTTHGPIAARDGAQSEPAGSSSSPRSAEKAAPLRRGTATPGDEPAVSQVLIVRRTRTTRAVAAEFERQLRLAYPVHPDDALASLAGTAAWPGPAMIWAVIDGACSPRTRAMRSPHARLRKRPPLRKRRPMTSRPARCRRGNVFGPRTRAACRAGKFRTGFRLRRGSST
jgi:hypothetical protein